MQPIFIGEIAEIYEISLKYKLKRLNCKSFRGYDYLQSREEIPKSEAQK